MIFQVLETILLFVLVCEIAGFLIGKVIIRVLDEENRKRAELIRYIDEGDVAPPLYQEHHDWLLNEENDDDDE